MINDLKKLDEYIEEYVNKLIGLLALRDYLQFIKLIDIKKFGKSIWIEDENSIIEWIENNGCDIPLSENGLITVTHPDHADGEQWDGGWLKIENSHDGSRRAKVEIALNGEWTDFHIYFNFTSIGSKPVVSFIGIP